MGIECNADGVSVASLGGGSNTSSHLVALVLQVQVDLSAHHFGNIDLSIQLAVGVLCHKLGLVVDILGTNMENELKKQIKATGFKGSIDEFCRAVSSGELSVLKKLQTDVILITQFEVLYNQLLLIYLI